MKKRNRGFSLIELLVVIALVIALCALVFAAMGPSREKARQGVCASNLRQWGTAFAMYAADYDGVDAQLGVEMTHAQLGLPPLSDVDGFMKQYGIFGTAVETCPSAHYPGTQGILRPRKVSYELFGFASEADTPGYVQYVAREGPDLTLVRCEMHNVDVDFEAQPSWATKWVQWLTIDQKLQFKQVPVKAYP